jgi:hypothetical protein
MDGRERDGRVKSKSFKLLAHVLWRALAQLHNFIQVRTTHIIGLEVTRPTSLCTRIGF